MSDALSISDDNHVGLTADIVAAYISNNRLQIAELPTLISSVHAAIGSLGQPAQIEEPAAEKATSAQIRKSITPDALISFIDGKPYKTLKRHLTRHELDPAGYRLPYGLPADYPTTAPNYSAARSALAKGLGLGRKASGAPVAESEPGEPEPAAVASEAPKRRGRKKADAAAD